MEFIISRTSAYSTCLETNDLIMCRQIDLPYEFELKLRVKTIKISDREERVVVIEIDSLKELVELQDRVGHELIVTTHMSTNLPQIEIYDTWRE